MQIHNQKLKLSAKGNRKFNKNAFGFDHVNFRFAFHLHRNEKRHHNKYV